MNEASRPHDETVIELLREDPTFADEYLAAALDEVDQPCGREALLAALRHIAEASRHDRSRGTRRYQTRKPLQSTITQRKSHD